MTSMLDDNWRKITRKLIERCQITTIGSQQKRVTSSHNVEKKNYKKNEDTIITVQHTQNYGQEGKWDGRY